MPYNRSNGKEPLGISEILEPLHACLRELLERDKRGLSHHIEYTDRDIVAASLLYAHILGNRLVHNLTRETASLKLTKHLASTYGGMIAELTRGMTGIDVNVFTNGKEKD